MMVVGIIVGALVGSLLGAWFGYKFGVLRTALDLLQPGREYHVAGVHVACNREGSTET
jgi:hypothetical protein